MKYYQNIEKRKYFSTIYSIRSKKVSKEEELKIFLVEIEKHYI